MLSSIVIILLIPLLIWIALLIKKKDSGPVFYRGVRIGRYGRPFRIFKFRTMVVDAEKLGGFSTANDDPRITKLGLLLRKYKLDEIPQLINVLRAEMSIIGPRPQFLEDVALYTKEEKIILSVRPGITDWASIKFHNEGEILRGSLDPDKGYKEKIRPEKIMLELEYVKTSSFWVDLKILSKTIKTLFASRM